jgi:hypothetical protein
VRLDVESEIGQVVEDVVPGATLSRRRSPGPQHVIARARPEPLCDERQEGGAHPAAQVSRVVIRRIVVDGEAELGDVLHEPRLREGEQRPDQSTAPTRGDSGEPRRRAALEEAEQNRLHLVVAVVRGHEVARAVTSLHLAEPRVARAAGDRLRGIRPEAQLADLERQLVPLRQLSHRPGDRPAVRSNAVIDVRDDQREAELRGQGVKQVEQGNGVGPS